MVKILLTAVPIFVFLFILNQNFAFTGVHRVSISLIYRPPTKRPVRGWCGRRSGCHTRWEAHPTYTDQVKFAVTLPRGFDTMTMTAELDADPFATLILDAKAAPSNNQAATFHLPTAFGSGWRSTVLDGGTVAVAR